MSLNFLSLLESLLKTKDAEIEKYKKYLSKAKKVSSWVIQLMWSFLISTFMQIIEGFGEKRTDTAVDSAEVQLLRVQVQERDRQLEKLEVCNVPYSVFYMYSTRLKCTCSCKMLWICNVLFNSHVCCLFAEGI